MVTGQKNYKTTLRKYLDLSIDDIRKYKEVYIFCVGVSGRKIYHQFQLANIKIAGFVENDIKKINKKLFGLNIFALKELLEKKDSLIIIASNNYFYEIKNQLVLEGFENIIPSYILPLLDDKVFKWEVAFEKLNIEYSENFQAYEKIRTLFKDEKSLEVFDGIINFRKTFDVDIYKSIMCNPEQQYFEQFINYQGEVFVDCGAFNGDTICQFTKLYENYNKIYYFEPDENSFRSAKENLKKIENILFFNKAVSDFAKTLMFDSRGDFGSCLLENGDIEMDCISLDEIIEEPRAFIKMDIEGAEIDAINGAKNLIKNNSILAICVYHKPSDLRLIPQLILDINPNYNFYLRHYTTNLFDTVLYAVPTVKNY